MLHLNFNSVVGGSTLNWCEQKVLRESMSEDKFFAKTSEPDMTAKNFNNHHRDRMGEVNRYHIKVFPKLFSLRHYDNNE